MVFPKLFVAMVMNALRVLVVTTASETTSAAKDTIILAANSVGEAADAVQKGLEPVLDQIIEPLAIAAGVQHVGVQPNNMTVTHGLAFASMAAIIGRYR